MADIKTRDVVKGTIKKIDKAAIAADRMRSAYVQTNALFLFRAALSENLLGDVVLTFSADGGFEGSYQRVLVPQKVGRKTIIRRDTLERFMTVNQGRNLLNPNDVRKVE